MADVRPSLPRARAPADHTSLEAVPFALDDVLARVADAVEKTALEKDLELVVHRSREVPPLLVGDPVRLGHVLLHLASNAVKFTAHGEVAIAAEPEAGARGGEAVVRFSVTDTGIGVNDRIVALFQPFRRKAPPDHRGEGSGLLFVRELVQSMGGDIEVVSAPGVGTDFTFTARFRVADAAAAEPTPAYGGLRVLIVDDNDTARLSLQHLLEAAGCRVGAASDGAEAIAMLRAAHARPFQLAIVDRGMRGMDGIETMRRIHHDERTRLPMVAMATRANRDETAACASRLAIPVEAYLLKPIKAEALYRAVSGIATPTGIAQPGGRRVDRQGALGRLGGSRKLLGRVLAEFCDAEADVAQSVEASMGAGRFAEAIRRIHGAKGTAMILGLEDFGATATRIETALRHQDRGAATAMLPLLASELAAALGACERERAALEPAEDAAGEPPAAATPERLHDLLDQLLRLLDRGSMMALELGEQLHRLLRGTDHADTAADIRRSLDKLDFAAARRRIVELAEELPQRRK